MKYKFLFTYPSKKLLLNFLQRLTGGPDNNDFCFSTIIIPCFLFGKTYLLVSITRESKNYSPVLRSNSSAGI